MRERKLFSVKKKATKAFDSFFDLVVRDRVVAAFVVESVADDRVIYRREVHTDLMRAASFDLDIEQRELFVTRTHFPERKCVAAVCGDRHFGPVPTVASDRPVDRPRIFTNVSMHERNV